jgi:N-acetylmuramoyl-L-alanine amidase
MIRLAALALSLSAASALANMEGGSWIFHANGRDYSFPRAGEIRGSPFVCLDPIVRVFGLKPSYVPETFELKLVNPSNRNEISLRTWSRDVQLARKRGNSTERSSARLSRRPEFLGARLCVPIDFGDRVLRPLLGGPLAPLVVDPAQTPKAQVVIDAGHGGNDHGAHVAVGDLAVREKDLVLLFAQELERALKDNGIDVLLTRRDDAFLTLPERSLMANASEARLFVSLHMNADPLSKGRGFEVYVLSLTGDDDSGRAAVARENQAIPQDLDEGLEKAISDLRARANLEASLSWAAVSKAALQTQLRPSSARSIRMGPFYLLYGALMPSVLLELGYLTDAEDRAFMEDAVRRRQLARTLGKRLATELKKN